MEKDSLDLLAPVLTGHTELRLQTNRQIIVGMQNGSLTVNRRTDLSGVSARVCEQGVYGFSSAPSTEEESVRDVLRAARENASFLRRKSPRGKPALPPLPRGEERHEKPFRDTPRDQMIDFIRAEEDHLRRTYPGLTSRTLLLRQETMEKHLVVSDGTNSRSASPRTHFYVTVAAETPDGAPVELFDVMGGGEGCFADYFPDPSAFHEKMDRLVGELMKKREGIFPEAGVADVVLDSDLAGILAHEAVGHTVEADLVLGGSAAGSRLGKRVASRLVTMVDFAHTALGERCPLPVYVDDEGTPARDQILIENGVLRGYMNSRETAPLFGMRPNGNARAYSYADEPLIRMRNTAILPGRNRLADLLASTERGYYLTRTNNGQADTTGEFMFGIMMGYEILHGKLGRALRETTISGLAFETLQTVTMLSDEMRWSGSGTCGKKQPMPVGMGGPAVKCRVKLAGK